jgi:phenylalanine-4-hydroxylase
MSLGASDRILKLLGAIYWFTVEFGLIRENGQMKFYGGGVASSVKEIKNAISNKDLRPLRLQQERPPTEFIIEDIQPFFYYIERFYILFF